MSPVRTLTYSCTLRNLMPSFNLIRIENVNLIYFLGFFMGFLVLTLGFQYLLLLTLFLFLGFFLL